MTRVQWDQIGERRYETGVDRGVLYIPNGAGVYINGYAWSGLTAVTQSPSGAEPTPTYADNMKYLVLMSREEFAGTIEAYTYPDEFAQCDGTALPLPGVAIGQQTRKTFGFCYRTRLGNDVEFEDYGYKLHLVYGALATPSEKAHATINETPEAVTFSWEFSTTPVDIPGLNPVTNKPYKPSAILTITSTEVDSTALAALEDILYGTEGVDPRLPTPAEVLALFDGTILTATPTEPAFVQGTNTITIPAVAGVIYTIDGIAVPAGDVVITQDTMVVALPAEGYVFPDPVDDDWLYTFV